MVTRKQHYVWREYLRSWAKDEQIHCRRGTTFFLTNLMNVGVGRDFYALKELSTRAIAIIHKLAIEESPEFLKPIHRNWVRIFTYPFRLRQELLSKKAPAEALRAVDESIIEMEEKLYGHIEGSAVRYLNLLRQKDITFLGTEHGAMDFIYYLCVQYFRTNKLRTSIMSVIPKSLESDAEPMWSVLRHIYSTNMANALLARQGEHRFILLVNNNSIPFITGDQPVINTKATYIAAGQSVEELELYYPISPTLALLITKASDFVNMSCHDVTLTDVQNYNQQISRQSLEQLYSSTEESLR